MASTNLSSSMGSDDLAAKYGVKVFREKVVKATLAPVAAPCGVATTPKIKEVGASAAPQWRCDLSGAALHARCDFWGLLSC